MANVSVGTVDRVIHNRGEVSEDSKKKILEILEKTGYKPNLMARNLSSGKHYALAAVVPNPEQDEYWNMVREGISEAQEAWSQYRVHIHSIYFDLYSKDTFKEALDEAIALEPDGILIAPVFPQEAGPFFETCKEKSIPFVLFNNNVPHTAALSFIGQNLYQSGRLGAELLHINQTAPGTYAILHIYDDISHATHLHEKESGFRDYFNGVDNAENKVISLDLNVAHQAAFEAELEKLLTDPALRGLLVTTSKGASMVSRMLQQHGKGPVRQVAYDMLSENLHYLNEGMIDFLINQNSRSQAYTGIRQLVDYLLFKKSPVETYLFPLEIISRQNLASYIEQQPVSL